MKFFAYIAATFAATVSASETFTDAEKEELYEMWAGQVERGELQPEVFLVLAQALDSDAPEDFFNQSESEDDDEPVSFAETTTLSKSEMRT